MRGKLIINPNAGLQRKKLGHLKDNILGKSLGEHIKSLFSKEGVDIDIFETKNPGDGTIFAGDTKAYDFLIAAGGDGTINEVINGITDYNIPLGIIPLGSENMLAKELKIPLSLKKACSTIAKGETRRIDLGIINEKKFVFVSGIGFDAQAITNVTDNIKKIFGRHSYTLAGIKTLFEHNPEKLRIKLRNEMLEGYFVIITNVKRYGGNIKIAPEAELDDGYMDLCVFQNKDLFSLMGYVMGAASKQMQLAGNIQRRKIQYAEISSEKKVLFHTDAEFGGHTPAIVKVLPRYLKILVP